MPPHIHGGKVINRRNQILPQAQTLCRCSECRTFKKYDFASDTIISGNLVSLRLWKKHQRQDEKRRVAMSRLTNLPDKLIQNADNELPVPGPIPNLNNETNELSPLELAIPASSSVSMPPLQHFTSGTSVISQSGDAESFPSRSITADVPPYIPSTQEHGRCVSNRSIQPHLRSRSTSDMRPISTQLASIRRQMRERITDTLDDLIKEQPPIFSNPPTKAHPPLSEQNFPQTLELNHDAIENYAILSHENWLTETLHHIEFQLQCNPGQFSTHDRLLAAIIIKDIKREFEKVVEMKRREWERQYDASPKQGSDFAPIINTAPFFSARTKLMEPITCLCYLLTASLYLLANVSMDDCALALQFLALIAKVSLKTSLNVERFKISHSIPSDVRTVINSLEIDPKSIPFVCCPKCFCTFQIDPDNANSYPEFCTHQQTPRSKLCGTRLREKRPNGTVHPVRRFLYQDFHQWIGRMYSRSDIEEHFDTYPTSSRMSDSYEMKDIWDGSVLKNFCGPDKKPFMQASGNEGRLVFGLNMDGFSPYSKRKGGKSVSICGIYLVCFNLPPEVRYKTKNVFLVGIVPGPKEPSIDQVNHVIRPLVDDFLILWSKGIYLTKTAKYSLGRSVRGALLPLICDLPAARRASGHGAHSATHFCSECDITRQEINNLDTDTWTLRNPCDHRKHADLWKNAKTEQEQERLFSVYGVRWSELLRLPYWDPTKHVVIDPMHGFYLRMFHVHVRDIWGMDVQLDDGDGISASVNMNINEDDMTKVEFIFRNGSLDQLEQLSARSLKYLCHTIGLRTGDHPRKLIESLKDHRIAQGWFTKEGIHVPSLPQDSKFDPNMSTRSAPDTADTQEQFLEKIYSTGSKTAITNLKKTFLLTLCAIRFKHPDGHYASMKKSEIVESILNTREEERAQDNEKNLDNEHKRDKSKRVGVLGRATLRAIREDMKQLGLPSYISPAPKHPGEVKWGNFKADEWKAFCTYNLPITLTRLWGSKPKDDRHYLMLEIFMELVSAVKLANLRTINEKQIILFDKHMRAYLNGLIELYPSRMITPYQHLSLHFSGQLRRFGPTHSCRCYAFERYNGIIQKIPTNQKFGQLEETMFNRFCRTQHLRVLFSECHLPPEVYPVIRAFEKRYKVNVREFARHGGPPDDSGEPDAFERLQGSSREGRSPEHIHAALQRICKIDPMKGGYIPNRITLVSGVERFGQLFQPMPHKNNAHVIFRRAPNVPWSAGVLQSLFTHKRWSTAHDIVTQTFAVIQEYEELVDKELSYDVYRRFPIAGGQLCYNQLRPEAILVPFKNIISHISHIVLTMPGIDKECVHVLPL